MYEKGYNIVGKIRVTGRKRHQRFYQYIYIPTKIFEIVGAI